ncbi:MAG: hypothetical protein ACRDNO_13735 [Trebonia sp.]
MDVDGKMMASVIKRLKRLKRAQGQIGGVIKPPRDAAGVVGTVAAR